MTIDQKILTAASDFMSRLDSSGALSLPGLDVKKVGDKYFIKDAELPKLAIEAVLLDVLGTETSFLDATTCKTLHTDERLAFLGLEGQPPQVMALFVRRAESLSAKLADLSSYTRYVPRDGLPGSLGPTMYEWGTKIKVPLQITGPTKKGILFTKTIQHTRSYVGEVRGFVEYEYNPEQEVTRTAGFHPRKLLPGDPWLVNPKHCQSFRVLYKAFQKDELITRIISPKTVTVHYQSEPWRINYDECYCDLTEYEFLRLLAQDAISRGGDTSALPELFESINLKTVAEKFK
jgi:hypothetical protein